MLLFLYLGNFVTCLAGTQIINQRTLSPANEKSVSKGKNQNK